MNLSLNNKVLLIVTGSVFLVFAVLFVLFYFQTPSQSPSEATPTPSDQTPKITISGIPVNNFLKSALDKNTSGDALFQENSKYSFVYIAESKQFLITILSLPFDQVRADAEQAFLQQLGISKEEACKLDVSISVPNYVDSNLSGEKHRLSFCQ